jgi:hypothetical protein
MSDKKEPKKIKLEKPKSEHIIVKILKGMLAGGKKGAEFGNKIVGKR